MKKYLVVAAIFFAPLLAGATSAYWDYSGGVLQPLQSMWGAVVKGSYFQATSTTASILPYASTTAISVSSLTSGNCVQASTGGLLMTTSGPCNTGTVTGVTGTYPIISSGGTAPAISIAFGTTTSNTWAGTQAFTNTANFNGFTNNGNGTTTSLAITGITGLLKGNGATGPISLAANGTDYTKVTAVSCTNQVMTALTAAGIGTCASVTSTMLSGAVGIAKGGTGTTTWLTNSIPYFNGATFTEKNPGFTFNGTTFITTNATTTQHTNTGNFWLTALGTPAGAVLAVDPNGLVIATTSASGAVSSVSNSDGTLTISPTTGAVVASLALGHENTWTGKQIFNIASTTSLFVGSTTPLTYPNAPLVITGNANSYAQTVMQNLNSGSSASADLIIGNDKSTDTSYYGDLGINSSTYSNASYTGLAANATYLYSNDSELDLGTATSTTSGVINFLTGGLLTANKRMIIDSTGKIGVGTTTPWAMLSASSTIASYENTVATSTNATIDWTQGNQQLFRIGTAGTTISFSNYVRGMALRLVVCNPAGASAGAITWSGVEWAGGTVPTQTTTANQCDVWSFIATAATSTVKVFGAASTGFN